MAAKKNNSAINKMLLHQCLNDIVKKSNAEIIIPETKEELFDLAMGGKDKKTNDIAVKEGERILARYEAKDKTVIWIITEWDRSYTTILFPEEY